MQKKILALALCALIPVVSIAVARADDDEEIEYTEYSDDEYVSSGENRAVGKRVTCADMKQEMDKLSALDEITEDDVARLASLKTDYRSKCMKRASGRMSGRAKIVVPNSTARPEIVQNEESDSETDVQTSVVAHVTKKPETKPAVNTSCDNPDKNGCCPGETYTDMGDLGFNCCSADAGTCFPPVVIQQVTVCDDGSNPDVNGCCAGEKYTDMGEQGFNCCSADGKTCFPPIKNK